MHDANSFITLTYDDEHLPPGGSLLVGDWQTFAKAWRNKLGKFRFFHCGEYGDAKGRPHLHAAIFGYDFESDREPAEPSPKGFPQWTSPTLEKLWGKGRTIIGTLTFESAAYVARYIMKKQTGDPAKEKYGWDPQILPGKAGTVSCAMGHNFLPEYTTMSRNPGIGATWIETYMREVYPRDEVVVNGHLCNPPKFYDDQYAKHDPAGYKRLKARRVINAHKYESDNTPDRLLDREKVQRAKIRSLSRSL